LEKYGFSGTVVVTPEFVPSNDDIRPTLRDVWEGRVKESDLDVRGFMTWAEMRAAIDRGVFSIQCHAMTHTWYPTSDTVVDFHHPGDGYFWLDWNASPSTKTDYMKDFRHSDVAFGTPVYAHEKSLAATRRYFPDPDESSAVLSHIDDQGGFDIFSKGSTWKETLSTFVATWREKHGKNGRMETADERTLRVQCELIDSREQISTAIGRPVDFMIWPGGGYDDYAMETALQHFKAVTISAHDRWRLANRVGEDPRQIVRRGIPALVKDGVTHYMGGRYLVQFIEEFKGSSFARKHRQVQLLGYMAAHKAGLWKPRLS
jgi:hypothetical protein